MIGNFVFLIVRRVAQPGLAHYFGVVGVGSSNLLTPTKDEISALRDVLCLKRF